MIDSGTGTAQQVWLKKFAQEVLEELKARPLTGVHPARRIRVEPAPYTVGCCAVVATLSTNDSLEIYVDTITRAHQPMVWVGCIVKGKDPRALHAAQFIGRRWRSPVVMCTDEAYDDDDDGNTYFRWRFTDFGRPIVELWNEVHNDIGVYWPDTIAWTRNPTRQLVRKSVQLLEGLAVALQSRSARVSGA